MLLKPGWLLRGGLLNRYYRPKGDGRGSHPNSILKASSDLAQRPQFAKQIDALTDSPRPNAAVEHVQGTWLMFFNLPPNQNVDSETLIRINPCRLVG